MSGKRAKKIDSEQLDPAREHLVSDILEGLKRMESKVDAHNTLAQNSDPNTSQPSLSGLRGYYQRHKRFFDTVGIINLIVAWSYLALFGWLFVTLIILSIVQSQYSAGHWLENDVWLIILLIGAGSGMVSAIISFMGSIWYKIPSIVLNACSVGLLATYTAYQAYKASPELKTITHPQNLIDIQFYLSGLIVFVNIYLVLVTFGLLIKLIVKKHKKVLRSK